MSKHQTEYSIELTNRFSPLIDQVNDQAVSDTYNQVDQAILDTAEKLGKCDSAQTKTNKDTGMDGIQQMNKRRKAPKAHRQDSALHQVEYTELNKTIRKKRQKL